MKNLIVSFILILTIISIISGCGVQRVNTGQNVDSGVFSDEEVSLIISADTLSPMRILQTDIKQDSLFLRKVSKDINMESNKQLITHLVTRMYKTVTDSSSMGVGIAAPQVGISKNVILVQRIDKEGEPFETYINPEIITFSKMKQDCREGCLSVPDISGTTKNRSYAILIKYQNLQNETKFEMIEGYTAVIFQHEIDHLKGVLFFDHLK